jgi:putative thioredoxin
MSTITPRSLPVISKPISTSEFQKLLQENNGILVFKFGAVWCNPCKTIEPALDKLFKQMPHNVQCFVVDIDQSSELYSFFKNKRVFKGVPTVIAYYFGNTSVYPDDMTVGANIQELNAFFERTYNNALTML